MATTTESARDTNGQIGVERIEALRNTLNDALRGKPEVVELVLAALLARGHLLIEDLPGLGETTLAKALACAIGGRFTRIQCTPDLLPGDITGYSIFNQQTRVLEFVPGPVFADVLLADEINRATPRTQSALLEVMAERQVTVDNATRPLSDRFFVIATQNPIELDGTFPLPEAQLDRFAMKVRIGYPGKAHLMELLESSVGKPTGAGPKVEQMISHDDLIALQHQVSITAVSPAIQSYVAELGEAIRNHPRTRLAASPRGLLIWLRLAQAWAHLQGRDFVTPGDVQAVARPVLEVRLSVIDAQPVELVNEVLETIPVPVLPRGR